MRESAITVEDGKRKKVMSQKALEANRNNAKKSTGPKNKQKNPLALLSNYKHGILASVPVLSGIESQEDFDQLVTELKTDMRPSGAIETALVEKLANILWKMKRLTRYENSHIENEIDNLPDQVMMLWKTWYERKYKNPKNYKNEDQTKLEELKEEIYVWESAVKAFEKFDKLPANKPIKKNICSEIIITKIREYIYLLKMYHDENIPDTPDDLFDFTTLIPNYWDDDCTFTPEQIKEVINAMCKEYEKDYEEVFSGAKYIAEKLLKQRKQELAKFEKEIEAKSCEKLFSGYVCERVMKYESLLNRLFMQTLHELQRMQGMRIGISAPPEAIDITGID